MSKKRFELFSEAQWEVIEPLLPDTFCAGKVS
jgi:hypothetical protein